MEIDLQKVTCGKCGYQWIPRVKNPIKCPHCGNHKWNSNHNAGVETD